MDVTAVPAIPARTMLVRHPEWLIIIILAVTFALTYRVRQHRLQSDRTAGAMLVIRATNLAAVRI